MRCSRMVRRTGSRTSASAARRSVRLTSTRRSVAGAPARRLRSCVQVAVTTSDFGRARPAGGGTGGGRDAEDQPGARDERGNPRHDRSRPDQAVHPFSLPVDCEGRVKPPSLRRQPLGARTGWSRQSRLRCYVRRPCRLRVPTILVTGASSGIGAALAPMLAARGATVGIVARRRERLEAVLAECQRARARVVGSGRWISLTSTPPSRSRTDAWNTFGGLDCVVHNAAIPKRVPVARLTDDLVDETMRINFTSPVRMTLALLGAMLERGRGLTAFVSSVGGRIGIAHEAAYCASKFALAGFSEAMAIDLYGTGVGVKLLLPGSIETEIWDQPGNDAAAVRGSVHLARGLRAEHRRRLEDDGFEYFVPPNMPQSDRTYDEVVKGKTSNVDGSIGAMGQMSHAHESGSG